MKALFNIIACIFILCATFFLFCFVFIELKGMYLFAALFGLFLMLGSVGLVIAFIRDKKYLLSLFFVAIFVFSYGIVCENMWRFARIKLPFAEFAVTFRQISTDPNDRYYRR